MGRSFARDEVLDIISGAEGALRDWRRVRGSVQADTLLVGMLAFDKMRR